MVPPGMGAENGKLQPIPPSPMVSDNATSRDDKLVDLHHQWTLDMLAKDRNYILDRWADADTLGLTAEEIALNAYQRRNLKSLFGETGFDPPLPARNPISVSMHNPRFSAALWALNTEAYRRKGSVSSATIIGLPLQTFIFYILNGANSMYTKAGVLACATGTPCNICIVSMFALLLCVRFCCLFGPAPLFFVLFYLPHAVRGGVAAILPLPAEGEETVFLANHLRILGVSPYLRVHCLLSLSGRITSPSDLRLFYSVCFSLLDYSFPDSGSKKHMLVVRKPLSKRGKRI